MDTLSKYQNALTAILEEYADYLKEPNLECQVICDYKRNHFQLLKTGWENGRHYHYCIFHFDIKDGKVWIQENRTDIHISQDLEAHGIPKAHIVLGLQSPKARAYSEFAAA